MELIGRNMSPFVRRVAIWCALQGRTVTQHALAATEPGDADAIRAFHPGRRVPVLVLDDGTKLIDSFAICDTLDEMAGEGRLVPAHGEARRDCLQRIALAHATSEKVVALVYEKNRRPERYHWADWQDRLYDQVRGGFSALEAISPDGHFFGGDAPDGSDIAAVCAYDWAVVTNADLVEGRFPAVAALSQRANVLPAFEDTHPG